MQLQNFRIELESIIEDYEKILSKSKFEDGSDVLSKIEFQQFDTRCLVAIERIAGRESIYFAQARNTTLNARIGVVKALLMNIEAGYLKTVEELIHGDLFSDFLEMASHLLENGYKDAAAVIAGTTLESHLKQLYKKIDFAAENKEMPKKADTINNDLSSKGIYSKLDQKNVVAWLGLRNNAAHGKYSEYDNSQVKLLISSIRDFITRIPA